MDSAAGRSRSSPRRAARPDAGSGCRAQRTGRRNAPARRSCVPPPPWSRAPREARPAPARGATRPRAIRSRSYLAPRCCREFVPARPEEVQGRRPLVDCREQLGIRELGTSEARGLPQLARYVRAPRADVDVRLRVLVVPGREPVVGALPELLRAKLDGDVEVLGP